MKHLLLLVLALSGCGFFQQKPVCPESRPRCTMDDDPVIMGSSSSSTAPTK